MSEQGKTLQISQIEVLASGLDSPRPVSIKQKEGVAEEFKKNCLN